MGQTVEKIQDTKEHCNEIEPLKKNFHSFDLPSTPPFPPESLSLFSLPGDIWKFNICRYLSSNEKRNLRLLCRWSCYLVDTQLICLNDVLIERYPKYEVFWKQSSWKSHANLMICFSKQNKRSFKSAFQILPSHLRFLDFSKCEELDEKYFCYLPSSLEKIFLPFNDWSDNIITEKGIDYLLNNFPNLSLEFSREYSNYTLLYWASYFGIINIVKLLISKFQTYFYRDLELKANGDLGLTPLYIACSRGHCSVVKLLLEKGAEVNVTCTGDFRTPLMTASYNGRKDVVQILLEAGADYDFQDRLGNTALSDCASRKFEAIESLIIEFKQKKKLLKEKLEQQQQLQKSQQ